MNKINSINDINHTACINQIKILSMDMISHANSGHPGMPLGCASIIYILWTKFLRFNYVNWVNRDRFVLSNGHGCAVLYSILFLLEYGITLDDLKNFRSLYNGTSINTKTTGHPERNLHNIVDVTTGPLGQGVANGVGMAISEKYIASKVNKPSYTLIDHKIYVMCGDGCIMEGIAYEAISLAGHLNLDNLVILYDDNNITIDGEVSLSYSENTKARFEAMNWNTIVVENSSENLSGIEDALGTANDSDKPVIIFFKTKIGYGTVNECSSKSHGTPLTENELRMLKIDLGFNPNKFFEIKNLTKQYFNIIKNTKKHEEWYGLLDQYKIYYPHEYYFLINLINNNFEYDIDHKLYANTYNIENMDDIISTRKISGSYLKILGKYYDNILCGSADLASSTCTFIDSYFSKDNYSGKYISYGIREHAMCAIANGISTYNIIPFVSTFLAFSTYGLGAIRLSAISNHKVIYIFTHDSLAIGEDGTTHQPVEHLLILRSIPNLLVFRPADYNEVLGSYNYMLKHKGPSCICLTRQDITNMSMTNRHNVKFGAYVVYETNSNINLIIISTGSEVYTSYLVIKKLEKFFYSVRLVSMPCVELFEKQSTDYKSIILHNKNNTKQVKTISVEIGSTMGWYKYADFCIGLDTFGASGKKNDLLRYFNLDVDGIYDTILNNFPLLSL